MLSAMLGDSPGSGEELGDGLNAEADQPAAPLVADSISAEDLYPSRGDYPDGIFKPTKVHPSHTIRDCVSAYQSIQISYVYL